MTVKKIQTEILFILREALPLWLSWLTGKRFYYPPKLAQLIITHRCNSRCIMCDIWKKYKEHPEKIVEELGTNEWKKVFQEMRKIGIKSVSVSGGEPFLRDDIMELLKELKKNGFYVSLTTNGLLLKDKIDNCFSYLDSITVSIDGSNAALHDSIRNIKVFNRAVEGIKKVKELNKGGVHQVNICISSTIFNKNVRDLENIIPLVERLGGSPSLNPMSVLQHFNPESKLEVVKVEKSSLINHTSKVFRQKIDFLNAHNVMSPAYIKGMQELFEKNGNIDYPGRLKPCFAGVYSFVIGQDGSVFPCYPMYKTPCGNVKLKSLKEILSSKEFKGVLNKIRMLNCPSCWGACYAFVSFYPLNHMRIYCNYLNKFLKKGNV